MVGCIKGVKLDGPGGSPFPPTFPIWDGVKTDKFDNVWQELARYGMICRDIARRAYIWQDLPRFGNIWHEIARFCKIRRDLASSDTVWRDLTWFGKVWPDYARFGKIPLDFPRFGAIWQDSTRCANFPRSGNIWQDLARLTWFAKIWHDLASSGNNWQKLDKIWQDLTRYGDIWQDLATFGKICHSPLHLERLGNIWHDLAILGKIWRYLENLTWFVKISQELAKSGHFKKKGKKDTDGNKEKTEKKAKKEQKSKREKKTKGKKKIGNFLSPLRDFFSVIYRLFTPWVYNSALNVLLYHTANLTFVIPARSGRFIIIIIYWVRPANMHYCVRLRIRLLLA